MDLSKLIPGKNPPEDIYVVVEIPQDSSIKYELDKESGALLVDRFLFTAMHYPFNYGFIPKTLAEDGDPVDVLVVSRYPVAPGSLVRCRPVGALEMRDEEGLDTKLLAVPHSKVDPTYEGVKSYQDLPQVLLERIKHFFEHYKELEPGKWVKVEGFKGVEFALEEIRKGIERYKP
ncbi:MAG: inorganic diphosphatase [Aquificaceae bacterium]|nr:inorganic diphosphatase [Aquificaceae bacterium]MCX8060907.1 inorganic diphosphatase [Aquificaceae bacterium]MDW8097561.1 inorganic diphosphatase [Aquificaceae bacterium]